MLEFALSGGVAGALTKGASKAIGKQVVKYINNLALKNGSKIAKRSARNVFTRGSRMLGNTLYQLPGGVMRAAVQVPLRSSVYNDIIERQIGTLGYNPGEDGTLDYTGRIDADNTADAVTKGLTSGFITNLTESVGGEGIQFITNKIGGLMGKGANAVFKNLQSPRWYNRLRESFRRNGFGEFVKATSWQGPVAEYGEELLDQTLNAIFVGDSSLDPNSENYVFDLDNLIDTAITTGAISLFMGAAGGIASGKIHRDVNKAYALAKKNIDTLHYTDTEINALNNIATSRPQEASKWVSSITRTMRTLAIRSAEIENSLSPEARTLTEKPYTDAEFNELSPYDQQAVLALEEIKYRFNDLSIQRDYVVAGINYNALSKGLKESVAPQAEAAMADIQANALRDSDYTINVRFKGQDGYLVSGTADIDNLPDGRTVASLPAGNIYQVRTKSPDGQWIIQQAVAEDIVPGTVTPTQQIIDETTARIYTPVQNLINAEQAQAQAEVAQSTEQTELQTEQTQPSVETTPSGLNAPNGFPETVSPSEGRVEGSSPSMTVASKREPSALAQSRPSESNLSKANNPQQTEGAVGGIEAPTTSPSVQTGTSTYTQMAQPTASDQVSDQVATPPSGLNAPVGSPTTEQTTSPSVQTGTSTNSTQAKLAHIASWQQAIDVPIVIFHDISEVDNPQAVANIQAGNTTPGWIANDTVYIYLPHAKDERDIDATIMHECIAHFGIPRLFATQEQADAFYDEVWNAMPEAEQYRLLSYPGVSHLKGEKARRVAADEYIAHLAEQIRAKRAGEAEVSLWQRIVSFFRNALRRANVNLRLNDTDLTQLLLQSLDALKKNNEQPQDTTSDNALDPNEVAVTLPSNGTETRFSIRSFREEGRAKVTKWIDSKVTDKEITRQEAQDILDQLDTIYDICQEYTAQYAPFGEWSEAQVNVDVNGNPVLSVIKSNGEYAMNLDFSLVCKKRRTLDAVFQEMIARDIINDFELDGVQVAKVNEIIRSYGFETACRLCFVDAKRFRIAAVADTFVKLFNELSSMSDRDLRKILSAEPKTVRGKAAKLLLNDPSQRIKVSRSDFMSAEGFERIKRDYPEIMKLYNAKKGTGGPKASFGDVQYLNDIENTSWTPDKAYAVGGVRLQSFSDYVPRMVFDYVQMIADLAAKHLPVHAYTKEDIFAKQFGLTGIKINLSLVPRVDPDGIAPGLDRDGNYVWQEGETFPYDTAIAIQNAPGYRDTCGTIAVGVSDAHILKMLDDENIRMVIPYHKSGLNPAVAIFNNIDAFVDYTNEQNTRYESGSKLSKEDSKNHFNFNEALRMANDNPRIAAQQYLDWCRDNNYLPKFDKFAEHPNYYKLLEDFTTMYTVDGVDTVVPQRAVEMRFPTEQDAFGSMRDLIAEGLEADAILEGQRNEQLPAIVDEIAATLPPKTQAKTQAKTTPTGLPGSPTTEQTISPSEGRVEGSSPSMSNPQQTEGAVGGIEAPNTSPSVKTGTMAQPTASAVALATANDKNKLPDTPIRFRMTRRTESTVTGWINRRTDLTPDERKAVIDHIDNLDGTTLQLATAKWFAQGTIRIPEDNIQVEQAIKVASRAKVDPLAYDYPQAIISAFPDMKPKGKPINPDDVPTLTNKQELPNGLTVYNVDESRESQQAIRDIIDTHLGTRANPWCITSALDGNLTDESWEYWESYSAYPKRIAFHDGKVVALFASDSAWPIWWDTQDRPHFGIPLGANITDGEYNEETNTINTFNEDGEIISSTPADTSFRSINPGESLTDYARAIVANTPETRFRVFGGNSGYVGYSMSKRAEQAREEGRYPKTDFKRIYGITDKMLTALVESGIVSNNEWHHTSKFGNKTTFYSFENQGAIDFFNENKDRIKEAIKNGTLKDLLPEFQQAANTYEQEEIDRYNKLIEEQKREIAERNSYNDHIQSILPEKYTTTNDVTVYLNGSKSPYYWKAEKNGFPLSKRHGRAARDKAFELTSNHLKEILPTFEQWKSQQVSNDSTSTTRFRSIAADNRTADTALDSIEQASADYADSLNTEREAIIDAITPAPDDSLRTIAEKTRLRSIGGELVTRDNTELEDFLALANNISNAMADNDARHKHTRIAESQYDSMQRLHNLIDDLRKQGALIDDRFDPWLTQNQARSRAQAETKVFDLTYRQPLYEAIARGIRALFPGINTKDKAENAKGYSHLSLYAQARTAVERQAIKSAQARAEAEEKGEEYKEKDFGGLAGIQEAIFGLYSAIDDKVEAVKGNIEKLTALATERGIPTVQEYIDNAEAKLGNPDTNGTAANQLWNAIRSISAYQLTYSYNAGLTSRAGYQTLTYGRNIDALLREKYDMQVKQIKDNPGSYDNVTDYDKDGNATGTRKVLNDNARIALDKLNQEYAETIDAIPMPGKNGNWQHLIDTGWLTEEDVNSLHRYYMYYMPLKGHAELTAEDIVEYENKTPRNLSKIKAVEGHSHLAKDPFNQLILDTHGAIQNAEQNRWRLNLYNILTNNPNPSQYVVEQRFYKIETKSDGSKEYVPYGTEETINGAQVFIPGRPTAEELANGTAVSYNNRFTRAEVDIPIRNDQRKEHSVTVMVDGEAYTMFFYDKRIADAINGTNIKRPWKQLEKLQALNRLYAGLKTSLNPTFTLISNLPRDWMEMVSNNLIEHGLAHAVTSFIYRVRATRAGDVQAALRKYQDGKLLTLADATTDVERYVVEFFNNGGSVNITQLPDYNTAKVELMDDLNTYMRTGEMPKGNALAREFNNMAERVELAPRLATYIASRTLGRNISQSVNDAKEATVNFDRKGSWSGIMGMFQLFYNASAQSVRRQIGLARRHPVRFAATYATIGLLSPLNNIMMSYIMSMLLGDDDDLENIVRNYFAINPELRRRYNIILIGNDYIRIPMAVNYLPYVTLGDVIANWRLNPNYRPNVLKDTLDIAAAILDTFTPSMFAQPIGFAFDAITAKNNEESANAWRSFAGSLGSTGIGFFVGRAIEPLMQSLGNYNFMGSTLFDMPYDKNSQEPAYLRARQYTQPVWVWASHLLNDITGGNDVHAGWLNIAPEQIENVMTVFGGYSEYAENIISLGIETVSILSGEKPDTEVFKKSFPLLSRLYGGNTQERYDKSMQSMFYDDTTALAGFNEYRKNATTPSTRADFDNTYSPDEQRYFADLATMESIAKKIRKEIKAATPEGETPKYHEDERLKAIYNLANEQFHSLASGEYKPIDNPYYTYMYIKDAIEKAPHRTTDGTYRLIDTSADSADRRSELKRLLQDFSETRSMYNALPSGYYPGMPLDNRQEKALNRFNIAVGKLMEAYKNADLDNLTPTDNAQ